jgi:hypothetical protein
MFGRKTFLAGFCMFAFVMGCVIWPASAPTTDDAAEAAPRLASLNGLPYCGASMQLHNVDNLAGYEKSCDEIAALGGDTVMFVPNAFMETASSTTIYIDVRHTLGGDALRQLIGHAKADKLRVILMPIVLLDKPQADTDWRGTIHPESGADKESGWDDWFESYQDMMLFYAKLAQETGVNVLVVGSELVSYHGQLTYSSNWDHYAMVQFWDALDIVGMNSYWKLGPDDDHTVSVDEIKRRWSAIQKDLFAWQSTVHKPILLLEAGWCSLANASYEPWDYTRVELALDLDVQKRLYQGFYESWWGKPQSAGFLMWEWTPESPGGSEDKGYTPRGKPAAEVMRDWLSKPRWKVE